jgi:hypothetical protein
LLIMVQDLKAIQVEMDLMPVALQPEEAGVVLDSREQRDRRVFQEMVEMDTSCRLHQSWILGSLVEEAVD